MEKENEHTAVIPCQHFGRLALYPKCALLLSFVTERKKYEHKAPSFVDPRAREACNAGNWQ
jgi:hypothetical protein